ncbi:MAG: VanZ family protein [Kiloniellaceae bacterium]
MFFLSTIVLVGIAYGSLFPFNFHAAEIDPATLDAFVASWRAPAGRGDIFANFVLFAPFGLVGLMATGRKRLFLLRLVLTIVAAVVFATALQVAQLFLPGRIAALNDVVWNTLGTIAGALAALVISKGALVARVGDQPLPAVPAFLLGTWIALRLIPFVPTLDFQAIKESLKPLLVHPEISATDVFLNAVSWLVVGYLLQWIGRPGRVGVKLALVMVGIFSLEVLIVANDLTASNVVGGVLALTLAVTVLKRGRRTAGVLSALLCTALVVRGLEPFALRTTVGSFAWLPFHGFLGGSVYLNTLTLLEKTFLYGSLIFLLRTAGLGWLKSALLTACVLLLIEIAQLFYGAHSPEITDPFLAILLTTCMVMFERHAPALRQPKRGQKRLV